MLTLFNNLDYVNDIIIGFLQYSRMQNSKYSLHYITLVKYPRISFNFYAYAGLYNRSFGR